tara:strand:+ start:393 stop:572 length:180 start_codon:yes stop_codon:yes gene_type:complete
MAKKDKVVEEVIEEEIIEEVVEEEIAEEIAEEEEVEYEDKRMPDGRLARVYKDGSVKHL